MAPLTPRPMCRLLLLLLLLLSTSLWCFLSAAGARLPFSPPCSTTTSAESAEAAEAATAAPGGGGAAPDSESAPPLHAHATDSAPATTPRLHPKRPVWAVVGFSSRSLVPDFEAYVHELSSRGYPVALVTFQEQLPWFNLRHSAIQNLSLGPYPPNLNPKALAKTLSDKPLDEVTLFSNFDKLLPLMSAAYVGLDKLLQEQKERGCLPGYMLCTVMNEECMHGARKYGIPYAAWGIAFGFKAWEAASNLVPPIVEPNFVYPSPLASRFYRTLLHPLRLLTGVLPVMRAIRKEHARLGIEPGSLSPSALLLHRPVLISTVLGFEMPRPLHYNTFVVGPTRSTASAPSLAELQEKGDTMAGRILRWLSETGNSHQKPAYSPSLLPLPESNTSSWLSPSKTFKPVLYIAFGSIFSPPPQTQARLISALPQLLKHVRIIWASKAVSMDEIKSQLGHALTPEMHRDLLLLPWSPQASLLQHASVKLFLTHAGAGSLTEGWAAGVPTVCIPISAEQGGNAVKARALGVSVALSKMTFSAAELDAAVTGMTRGFQALDSEQADIWRSKLLPSYIPRDMPHRVAENLGMPSSLAPNSAASPFNMVKTFLAQLPARLTYAAELVNFQAQGSAKRAVDIMEMDMTIGISHLQHPMIEQYSLVPPLQRWLAATNADVVAVAVILLLAVGASALKALFKIGEAASVQPSAYSGRVKFT